MAKPGDVVEVRAGLHGLEAPDNVGILLDRYRVKGVPWIRLLTVQGRLEVKAEHATKRAFRDRYDGDRGDDAAMAARLRTLISLHAKGGLAEEAEDDLGALEERLWDASHHEPREWTETELATELYGGEPSRQQGKDVAAALARCRRPGVGRFQTGSKGDRWIPWSEHEVATMRRSWSHLGDLRSRLLVTDEDEEGQRVFRRIDADADARPEDAATLDWVEAAMTQWIEYDGVPDGVPVAGLGGTGATNAFGMDLHRQLGYLAGDWIRGESTNKSSDYIQFLLELGRWQPRDAIGALVRRHVNAEPFFEHVPDPEAERLANDLPEPSLEGDPDGDREDLRHLTCYTIDPPDARDFDDAVGIEELPGDGHRVWVHIADVSHYVRLDSYLDRHAKKRATSVYLPSQVLPMLPSRISDHLCSLRDDGDRYALSVAMTVDAAGAVTGATFHKALIRVTENLHYNEALRRAEAGDEPFATLLRVAETMRQQRRGLDLDTGEIRVTLEAHGFDVVEKRGNRATRLIETLMVAANEAVAAHMENEGVPALLRCHDLPDRSRAQRLANQLAILDIDYDLDLSDAPAPGGPGQPGGGAADTAAPAATDLLAQLKAGGGKMNLFGGGLSITGPGADDSDDGDADTPSTSGDDDGPVGFASLDAAGQDAWLSPLRGAMAAIAAHPHRQHADVATLKVLQIMARAHYAPRNGGHFGLGLTHYCHFTSPIRRYPDLVVHRNLKWLIAGCPGGDPPHTRERLEALCDHCSDQERAAGDLERTVKFGCLVLAGVYADGSEAARAADQAALAGGAAGQRARVVSITPSGLFVRLDNGLEARVASRDLPGGPYDVDEWESLLTLRPDEAAARFDAADIASGSTFQGPDDPAPVWVRCRLGDAVTVSLAGRDVAAGRTGARVLAWQGQAVSTAADTTA